MPLVLGFVIAQVSLAAEAEPRKRALLIGVSVYPHLPESLQLRGPVNDVRLLRQVLHERLGFASTGVVVMSDDSPPGELPTRENISRELRRLAVEARPGDETFIYFSGHGTQQPDRSSDEDDDHEPDGLDEVLCTRDVAKITVQGGAEIPGGIVDDELAVVLNEICSAGANVWVVLDCCHSGTAVRGDETIRGIPPKLLLPEGSPAVIKATQTRGGEVHETLARSNTAMRGKPAAVAAGRLVVLYAAQSNEPTVEKRLPRTGPDRKPHGLLTFSLAQSLTARPAGLSYQSLVDELKQAYVTEGRTSPTPWMEGLALDRPVFSTAASASAELRLSRDRRGRSVVLSGAFANLAPGAILEVFDEAETLVAHAKVVEADLFGAVVEACAFGESPDVKPLPDLGRVAIVAPAARDVALRVYIEPAIASRLTQAAPEFAMPSGVEQVDDVNEADLSLRAVDGKCVLTSIADLHTLATLPLLEFSALDVQELSALLTARVRAQRLLAAAASPAESFGPSTAAAVRFDVRMLAFADARDRTGRAIAAPAELRDGGIVAFEIQNLGLSAIDVTLLLVDSAGRLSPVFPLPGREGDARVPIGKSLRTPRAVVEASAAGVEHLVVIAVAADGAPQTFAWAAEAAASNLPEPAIKRRGGGGSAEVVREILTGGAATRGAAASPMIVTKLSWRIAP
jgi:hypothetical protein